MNLSLLKWMTIAMALLLALASFVGIMHNEIYAGASINWATQTIVQDWFDLVVLAPFLFITAILLPKVSYRVKVAWLGAVSYTFYTFVIYAFSVRFNMLFPVYCLVLGLCFYSLMVFFAGTNMRFSDLPIFRSWLQKASAAFLMVFGVLFYGLWLLEVGTAIAQNTLPTSLKEADLYTNPVHVLDLSIVLPAFFIIGWQFLRDRGKAAYLAPAALIFSFLMSMTIASITFGIYLKGLSDSYMLAVVFAAIGLANLLMAVFLPKQEPIQRSGRIPVIFFTTAF
jgi:hypothetical protein